MRGLKKTLAPTKARGTSPSLSTASSASSTSTQPPAQQQPNQPRTYARVTKTLSSPVEGTSRPTEIVIRALKSYSAQKALELSFNTGDFLQVVGEAWAPDGSGWFEAKHPYTGAQGYVPISLFQIFSSGGYQPTPPPPQVQKSAYKHAHTRGPPASAAPFYHEPKQTRSQHQSHASLSIPQQPRTSSPKKTPMAPQPLYGVVRYDFVPEKSDELQARKGEAIVLIAHSHHDWFVAKPIGRLGGPGLIPVNYVEVKDLATGKGLRADAVRKLIENDILPGVNEWKRATAAYRGNSIPLGRFENPTTTPASNIPPGLRREMSKSHQQLRSKASEVDENTARPPRPVVPPSPNLNPSAHRTQLADVSIVTPPAIEDNNRKAEPIPEQQPVQLSLKSPEVDHNREKDEGDDTLTTSNVEVGEVNREDGYATVDDLRERYGLFTHASVQSFHQENDSFWFHLQSHFNSPSSTNSTGEETTVLVLYRLYDDFFDFHAELLDTFPEEAGRENYDRPNIFPKLPEPKDVVDEVVCAERVIALNAYLQELSKLPSYIRDCEIFYEFLGPREGDVELLEELPTSVGSHDSVNKPVNAEQELHGLSTSGSTSNFERDHGNIGIPPSTKPLDHTCPPSQRQSFEELDLSCNKLSMELLEPNPAALPITLSSHPPNATRKTHRSNFSASSTASLADSTAMPAPLGQLVPEIHNTPPKPFCRIKIYQENSSDVIAIKAMHHMSYDQLRRKVFERVQASAPVPETQKIGKLYIQDGGNNPQGLKELESDEMLTHWLSEFRSRLVLLYRSAD